MGKVMERRAIVTFESGRGYFFAENLTDHSQIFIHARDVANDRYLHVDDIVEFELAENPQRPGKFLGRNVRWVGHCVARQTAEKAVPR